MKEQQPITSEPIEVETLDFIAPVDSEAIEVEKEIDFMINKYCPSHDN